MKVWKITCRIDNGAKAYQETLHVVAPTQKQAVETSLQYWRNESYDTDATVVNISGHEIGENDVVIL